MNKPLLQWKREIEGDIKESNKNIEKYKIEEEKAIFNSERQFISMMGINYWKGTLEELNKKLQMIDDIIEQKEDFKKWLKIAIHNSQYLSHGSPISEFDLGCKNAYENVLNKLGE